MFIEYTYFYKQQSILITIFQSKTSSINILIYYFIYKFIITILCVTLPLPVGLFTPVFLTGAIIGRIIGDFITSFPNVTTIHSYEFALLGAASFSTGVTRAISTAVIVFEICGLRHLNLPISLSVLTAYFIGNRFTKNVYDVLSDTNGTPFLQNIPKQFYSLPVSEVMIDINEHHVLSLTSTYRDAYELLKQYDSYNNNVIISDDISYQQSQQTQQSRQQTSNSIFVSSFVIPIVQSKETMVIIGAILREDMKRILRSIQNASIIASSTPIALDEVYSSPRKLSITTSNVSNYSNKYNNNYNFNEIKMETKMESKIELKNLLKTELKSDINIELQTEMKNEFTNELKIETNNNNINNKEELIDGFNEIIQYVLYSSDGNSIIPVASNNHKSTWISITNAIEIDPSPFQIVDTMQLNKVIIVFRLLKLNQVYITRNGRLIGIITRSIIREFIANNTIKPLDCFRNLYKKIFLKNNNSNK